MTRNLFIACALVAAAALATVRALDPGCEGSFCLGSGAGTGADQDRAGASEVPGTGEALLGGNTREAAPAAAPQASLSTADTRANWNHAEPPAESEPGEQDHADLLPEPDVAPEDWQGQRTASTGRAARNEPSPSRIERDQEPEPSYEERRAEAAAAAKAAEEWEGLAEAALKEPDDEKRGEAINGVALRRSVESVAVLNEVAALDSSPDNRLQAVQQLWFSAADGLDSDGMIRSTLETALDDPDEAIVKMAEQALADLKALEEAREEVREEALQFN